MNKIQLHRLLAAVVPILCLAVGGWVVWSQKTRLESLTAEYQRVEKNLKFQKDMIAAIGNEPLAQKEPTVASSDAEQAEFLDGLRTIAKESGVTLTKWTNVAAPAQDPEKKDAGLPQGVSPILSTLEVNGPYPNVRQFLYTIARAPRLLNFSGIRWARSTSGDNTDLSVTITRYVSATAPAAASPTTSASGEAAEKSS